MGRGCRGPQDRGLDPDWPSGGAPSEEEPGSPGQRQRQTHRRPAGPCPAAFWGQRPSQGHSVPFGHLPGGGGAGAQSSRGKLQGASPQAPPSCPPPTPGLYPPAPRLRPPSPLPPPGSTLLPPGSALLPPRPPPWSGLYATFWTGHQASPCAPEAGGGGWTLCWQDRRGLPCEPPWDSGWLLARGRAGQGPGAGLPLGGGTGVLWATGAVGSLARPGSCWQVGPGLRPPGCSWPDTDGQASPGPLRPLLTLPLLSFL